MIQYRKEGEEWPEVPPSPLGFSVPIPAKIEAHYTLIAYVGQRPPFKEAFTQEIDGEICVRRLIPSGPPSE
jgi:hypothetical protein